MSETYVERLKRFVHWADSPESKPADAEYSTADILCTDLQTADVCIRFMFNLSQEIAALARRLEQAERERDIYRRGAKWSGELFCWCIENLDDFVQLEGDANDEIKRRLNRLKATEKVLDQEASRATAAESREKRLREGIEAMRPHFRTWLDALVLAKENAETDDSDAFWGRAIEAFVKAFNAVLAQPSDGKEAEGGK